MFKFIGTGSAFNTRLGNNGAFIKKDNILFMIDCGSSTFERIVKNNLLEGVERVIVLITHTHPDHIGSLGDLAFYTYYNIKPMFEKKLVVFSHYDHVLGHLLNGMGVTEDVYDLVQFDKGGGYHLEDFHILFDTVKVDHVQELSCFGYIIEYEGETSYYSGDSYMIPDNIIDLHKQGKFDYFYQDVSSADYDGNVHLSLKKLSELIESQYRDNVFCMHLDGGFVSENAYQLGFNVVESM
ncbi:MBL fold metallo-hydrolase [Paenibacillus medicaginis]|uniref:MBL fold metallo-hydrolase n=1 Tax=Paenibacillus medicaginis TaxID=1470560 RepID=A0ABV5BUU2_9BACL